MQPLPLYEWDPVCFLTALWWGIHHSTLSLWRLCLSSSLGCSGCFQATLLEPLCVEKQRDYNRRRAWGGGGGGGGGRRRSRRRTDPVDAVLIFFLGLLELLPGNSPGTSVCGEIERLIGGGREGGGGGEGGGTWEPLTMVRCISLRVPTKLMGGKYFWSN